MQTGNLDGQGLAELRNYKFQNLSSAPTTNISKGRYYFNTTDNTLYVYNGTSWVNALAQGTTYTAGTGIDITGSTISVDFTDVATAAQGALADSAIQPGDNITELTNNAGYITGITSSDVTTALGYTPYNSSNPNGYISGITGADVTTALGYTPYNATNPNGYQANVIESIKVNGTAQTITSKSVDITVPTATSDLTNDSGFITSSDLPTVNDATLTIQKNGTNVATFTANSSSNATANITVPTSAADVGALPDTTTINDLTSSAQQAALNSGATTTNIGQIATNTSDISTIEGKIPSQASSSNQLADKAFVNSTIQTATANFRGSWATWAAVPTNAADYPVDYAGSTTPTVNDYLVVQDASGYTSETLEGTWRFKYSGTWSTDGKNGWLPEYQVNETPLTAAQLAAINSGITDTLVTQIGTNQSNISSLQSTKQDASTAVTHTASTAVGSSTTPVYIASDGTATPISYTIQTSVPSGAVFTDTTYNSFSGADGTSAGTAGLVPAPAATDNTKYLKGDGSWDSIDALPSQTGNNGKFLTTNGTTASWATVDALPSQSGNSGKFLTTNGTTASWANASTVTFVDWSV